MSEEELPPLETPIVEVDPRYWNIVDESLPESSQILAHRIFLVASMLNQVCFDVKEIKDSLKDDIDAAHSKLTSVGSSLDQLRDELSHISSINSLEINSLKGDVDNLLAQLSAAQQLQAPDESPELENALVMISSIEDKLKDVSDDISRVKSDVSAGKDEVSELADDLTYLKNSSDELRKVVAAQAAEIEGLVAMNKAYSSMFSMLEGKISRLDQYCLSLDSILDPTYDTLVENYIPAVAISEEYNPGEENDY